MTMRQRGWIPSADRAHRPADVALLDTMQIVVDMPAVTRSASLLAASVATGRRPVTAARRASAFPPHSTGAVSACPGSFTSNVVSLEVTT